MRLTIILMLIFGSMAVAGPRNPGPGSDEVKALWSSQALTSDGVTTADWYEIGLDKGLTLDVYIQGAEGGDTVTITPTWRIPGGNTVGYPTEDLETPQAISWSQADQPAFFATFSVPAGADRCYLTAITDDTDGCTITASIIGAVNTAGPESSASSSVAWDDVTGKPSTFAPEAHGSTHSDGTDNLSVDQGVQITSGRVRAKVGTGIYVGADHALYSDSTNVTRVIGDTADITESTDATSSAGTSDGSKGYAPIDHNHENLLAARTGAGGNLGHFNVLEVTGQVPTLSSKVLSLNLAPFSGDVATTSAGYLSNLGYDGLLYDKDDPDTGTTNPGANQIGFQTGGTQQAIINSSGDLGLKGILYDHDNSLTYIDLNSAPSVDVGIGGAVRLSLSSSLVYFAPGVTMNVDSVYATSDTDTGWTFDGSDGIDGYMGGTKYFDLGANNLTITGNVNSTVSTKIINTSSGVSASGQVQFDSDAILNPDASIGVASSAFTGVAVFANRYFNNALSSLDGTAFMAQGSGDDHRFYAGGVTASDEMFRVQDSGNVLTRHGIGGLTDTNTYLAFDGADGIDITSGGIRAIYADTDNVSVRAGSVTQDKSVVGRLYSSTIPGAEKGDSSAAEANFDESIALAANYLRFGRVIRVHYWGEADATAAQTITFRIKLGTTVIVASDAVSVPAASGNAWRVDGTLMVNAAGASGVINGMSTSVVEGATTDSAHTETGSATIDTTAAQTLQLSIQYSGSSASNGAVLRGSYVEALN